MLLNSLSVLFDFSKWESITSAFGIIILSGFLLGLAIESWNTWSLTRIFRGKKFNHKKLSAANIKFKGSFLKGSGEKTRHHADEFFELNKLQSYNSVVEAIPNSLVGIGILGTFLGLSIGVMGLKDQSSAEAIKEGVQSLLGSMSTAFVTSVLGMFFSILMIRRLATKRHAPSRGTFATQYVTYNSSDGSYNPKSASGSTTHCA